jgi:hypothetical protein
LNRTEVFQALTAVIRDLIALKQIVLEAPEQHYAEAVVLTLNIAIDSLQEIRLYL